MAYSADKHKIFSQRVQAWSKTFQNLRDELARLDEIYTNETSSGADSDFVDTEIATKDEHIGMIVFMRAAVDFVEGGTVPTVNRTSNLTAFTQ